MIDSLASSSTSSGISFTLYSTIDATLQGIDDKRIIDKKSKIKGRQAISSVAASLASTASTASVGCIDNMQSGKYLYESQNYIESLSDEELNEMLLELDNLDFNEDTENKVKTL